MEAAHFSGRSMMPSYFTDFYYLSSTYGIIPPTTKMEINDWVYRYNSQELVYYHYLVFTLNVAYTGYRSGSCYTSDFDSFLYGTPKKTIGYYPLLFCNGKPFIKLFIPAVENTNYKWMERLFLNPQYFNMYEQFPKLTNTAISNPTQKYPIVIREIATCSSSAELNSYMSSKTFTFVDTGTIGYYSSVDSGGVDDEPHIDVYADSVVSGVAPLGIKINLTVPKGDQRAIALCTKYNPSDFSFDDIPCFLRGEQDSNASSWSFYNIYPFVFSPEFFDFKELFPRLYKTNN